MLWRDQIRGHLLEMQPAGVCALDESAYLLVQNELPTAPVYRHDTAPDSPCALALGIDILSGLNAQQAQHLINRTRLYIAPRILLAVPSDCALDEAAFRALGFMQSATDPTDSMRVFHYDLDTYKTVPDWLNARYWAHPERWTP
ncbi:MAG: DUF6231 family protein [Thiobacillus sp.]|nr:DUF6231 family protein [Thiobacillus sp.]